MPMMITARSPLMKLGSVSMTQVGQKTMCGMPLWRRSCMLLGPHSGLIHIKEVALLDGFHIHMGLAPLGTGPTNWAEALALMAPHLPDDSWAILEHVADPAEASQSLAHLRAAADQAGVALE